jgi:hypothetical protein
LKKNLEAASDLVKMLEAGYGDMQAESMRQKVMMRFGHGGSSQSDGNSDKRGSVPLTNFMDAQYFGESTC